ncbi:MAG TPA: ScyD/ScyE family protein [Vicinamibacterales bacterium]
MSLTFITLITAAALLAGGTVAGAQTVEVVASGLDNPRGLAFAPNGDLYVAEAGSGGSEHCHVGPTGPRCFGTTGAITRIDLRTGNVDVVVAGLPSLGDSGPNAPAGSSASGPHHLGFQGVGNLYFTIGFGGEPALRSVIGPHAGTMAVVGRATPNGAFRVTADIGTFEESVNPDQDLPDSNPYGILVLPGKQIVADAGANALFEIRANGQIRTLAVFDELAGPPSRDAVPTGLAVGPDGAYYVGQLTGGPFATGIANIYRVPAEGGEPEVYASGFTNVVDLAFGADGSLYVLQIANPIPNFPEGALIRVAPDGTRTAIDVPLFAPGGIAIAKDGTIYVTINSILPGAGQVLAIRQ